MVVGGCGHGGGGVVRGRDGSGVAVEWLMVPGGGCGADDDDKSEGSCGIDD